MRGRRGPGLIGTAVVVGGAAHMGAKSAQRSQAAAQQEAAQNAQIADIQAQQGAAAAVAAAPAAPAESDDAAEIQKYAALKEQGMLTRRRVRGEEEADPRHLATQTLRYRHAGRPRQGGQLILFRSS